MFNVTTPANGCKLVLTSGLTGRQFQVEKLRRKPGDYRKGFKLTGADGAVVFCHELANGLHECNCPNWTRRQRSCAHLQLLVAAGVLDEPVDLRAYDPFEDELVQIDWESDAPRDSLHPEGL